MKASRAFLWLPWTVAVLASLGCEQLPQRQAGICGNSVIEPGEDCDRFAAGESTVCAAAGSPHECRWVCSPGVACPSGFGCGLDGVCRTSSARFEPSGAPLTTPHEILETGDFNGDSLADLLIQTDYDSTGFRLASVSLSGAASRQTLGLPPLQGVHLEDLNGDGKSDIIFLDKDGISALLSEEGSFQPVLYPLAEVPEGIQVRLFALDADPKRIGEEFFGVFFLGGEASLANFDGASLSSDVSVIASLGSLTPEDILFPPSLGSFTQASCPTVILPVRSRRELLVWPSCEVDGVQTKLSSAPPRSLSVPEEIEIRRPFSGDINGDGLQDLILPAEGKLWVSLGDGQGFQQVQPWVSVQLPAEVGDAVPLLVRDLNGDGLVDVVLPDRLLMATSASGGYQLAFERVGNTWGEAIAADFNGDGLLDIVAANPLSSELDFLLQSSAGLFTNFRSRAGGNVSLLSVGDFDGDGTLDLAYAAHEHGEESEDSEPSQGSVDHVEVIFGKAQSTPEAPKKLAQTPELIELVPGRIGRNNDLDNAWELTVQYRTGETSAISTIRGSSDRSLRASRQFLNGTIAASSVALSTDFSDGSVDIISLAREPDGALRLWGTEAIELGEKASFFSDKLPAQLLENNAELDDDTGAVMVSDALASGEDSTAVVAASTGQGATQFGLLVARRGEGSFELGPVTIFDGHISKDSKMSLLNLRKGARELVLSTGAAESPGPLLLFHREGALSMALDSPIDIPGDVAAWTCRDRKDGTCEILAINESGVYRVIAADREPRFGVVPVEDLPGGIAITSGDLDGDGVSDVVIGDGNSIQFFRSIPVLP